jgi:putative flippase GtrA
LRYVIAGGANTGISYLLYLSMLRPFGYRIAFSIAFMAGVGVGYAINALVVFRKPVSLTTAFGFVMVYVVQYVLGLALTATLVEWLGVPAWLAPIVALAIVVPLTFVTLRRLFGKGKAT